MQDSLKKGLFCLIVVTVIVTIVLAFMRDVPIVKVVSLYDNEFDSMGIEFPVFNNVHGITVNLIMKNQEDMVGLNMPVFNFRVLIDDKVVFNHDVLMSDISKRMYLKEKNEALWSVNNDFLEMVLREINVTKTPQKVVFIFRSIPPSNNIKKIEISVFGVSGKYKELNKIKIATTE